MCEDCALFSTVDFCLLNGFTTSRKLRGKKNTICTHKHTPQDARNKIF